MNRLYLYYINIYLYSIAFAVITLIIGFIIGNYYGQLEIINKLEGYYCTNSVVYRNLFNTIVR
jgi:hypothetical protein